MNQMMDFEVTAFANDDREETACFRVEVTEEDLQKLRRDEDVFRGINHRPDLEELLERVQQAEPWVPFEEEEDWDALDVSAPCEYLVSFPKQIMDEVWDRQIKRERSYHLKGLRWGYDGGGVGCGPVEGSILVEAAVMTHRGTLRFYTLNRFAGFAKVTVSSVPLFDILMQLPDWDLRFDAENEILSKCIEESWEFENDELPEEIEYSVQSGIYKLLLQAERLCPSDEKGEDFEGAQKFLASFFGQDDYALQKLEWPEQNPVFAV